MAKEAKTPKAPVKTKTPMPSGYSVASFVIGMLSFLLLWALWFSIPLSIAAILLGTKGMKNPAGKGLAIAGFAAGILSGVIAVLILLSAIVLLGLASSGFSR